MNRHIQAEEKKLQKASEQMNMRPIWAYTKNMRKGDKHRRHPIKNENGDHAINLSEELQCWGIG